jgi:hypothetical protein
MFRSICIQKSFSTALFLAFELNRVKCIPDNLVNRLAYKHLAAAAHTKSTLPLLLLPFFIALFTKEMRTRAALNWILHD